MGRTAWRKLEIKHLLGILEAKGCVEVYHPLYASWNGDEYELPEGSEVGHLDTGPSSLAIKLFATKESSPINLPCFAIYGTDGMGHDEKVSIECHVLVPPGSACGYPREDVSSDPKSEELRSLILQRILEESLSDEDSWLLRYELGLD